MKAEKTYLSIGWVRTSPENDRYGIFAMHRDLAVSAESLVARSA